MNGGEIKSPADVGTPDGDARAATTIISENSAEGKENALEWMEQDLAKSGIPLEEALKRGWKLTERGYEIPFVNGAGAVIWDNGTAFKRTKLREPLPDGGKYLSPKGSGIHPYLLPEVCEHYLSRPESPLLVTEGEKKCLSALLKGVFVAGLCGIWMWIEKGGSRRINSELAPLLRGRRKVVLIYDSDAEDSGKKESFEKCARHFAGALSPTGCELFVVVLPSLSAVGKTGLDDFLVHISKGDFERLVSVKERKVEPENGREVLLPGNGRGLREFITETAETLADTGHFYSYGGESMYLENDLGPSRLCPLGTLGARSELELFCRFMKVRKDGLVQEPISEADTKAVLNAPLFHRLIPAVEGLADYTVPARTQSGGVVMSRLGYDPETKIWTAPNGLDLGRCGKLSLEEALSEICDLLQDFCFERHEKTPELHLNSAIAYLLTAHCRLLFSPSRSPVFFADGNRPGVGKDFLLGLGPLLSTGRLPEFMPPIGDMEETRKRILSVCREGHRFMLVSNQKGHLDNAAYEAATTSPMFSDRLLGVSETRTHPNRAIYGLSGNRLTMSEDMCRRCLRISLCFEDEDIEKRVFAHPNLYKHALENRLKILSAFQRMVREWTSQGVSCRVGHKAKF